MSKFLRILFLSTLLFLFACGSEEAANLDPQIVKVVDDEFSPRVLRVEPGTTVIWESGGANNHNVIASDGSWQAISSDYFEYGIITKGDQYEKLILAKELMMVPKRSSHSISNSATSTSGN